MGFNKNALIDFINMIKQTLHAGFNLWRFRYMLILLMMSLEI